MTTLGRMTMTGTCIAKYKKMMAWHLRKKRRPRFSCTHLRTRSQRWTPSLVCCSSARRKCPLSQITRCDSARSDTVARRCSSSHRLWDLSARVSQKSSITLHIKLIVSSATDSSSSCFSVAATHWSRALTTASKESSLWLVHSTRRLKWCVHRMQS